MKRYILTALISLVLSAGTAFATGNTPQVKKKSEVEVYMQKVARIKSSEINYSYISASMFKQMFAMLGNHLEGLCEQHPFTTITCMRQLASTGRVGYELLSDAMKMFLQEDETVAGMKLMALNREEGTTTVIYSDSKNVLVINDDGDVELTVIFVAGLTYDAFKAMNENGVNIGF